MIDPELKYCPRCRDEYRADIELCGACQVTLLTGREMLAMETAGAAKRAGRKGDITADDELVTIQAGPLTDMRRLEELLTAERIGTLVVCDQKSCGKSCCPSTFHLQVRREDAPDAFALIQEEHRRQTSLADHHGQNDGIFNADAGQATCPACGFTFSTDTTTCPDCGLNFG